MVFFIFILLLMFSLSGVLYLMVRALPRVTESGAMAAGADSVGTGMGIANGDGATGNVLDLSGSFSSNPPTTTGKLLDRWAHSQLPEKIDAWFNEWLLKSLRKFKVFTLKLDNSISKHLHKINRENAAAEKKAAIDFKEIAEKGEGE